MDVGELGTRTMKCELEDRKQDLDPERAEAKECRLVHLAPAEQEPRYGENERRKEGHGSEKREDFECGNERGGRVLMEPTAEFHIPTDQRVAGQVVLHDVAEGSHGPEKHQQKERLRLKARIVPPSPGGP